MMMNATPARLLLPVALLLLLAATWPEGATAGDSGKKEDTAPTSTLTIARVERILHVSPKAGTGGKISLAYDLKNEIDQEDFESLGVEGPNNMRIKGFQFDAILPEISVTSDDTGLYLNKLPLKGEITLECRVVIRSLDAERSNMAFVLGYEPKTRKWIGARFGESFVVSNGKRVSAPGTDSGVDLSPFVSLHQVAIKLVKKGDKASVYLNNSPKGTLTTTQGDGRWGFLLSHVQVAFFSLAVTGVPDLPPEPKDTEKH